MAAVIHTGLASISILVDGILRLDSSGVGPRHELPASSSAAASYLKMPDPPSINLGILAIQNNLNIENPSAVVYCVP